jgi:hypothetical protein
MGLDLMPFRSKRKVISACLIKHGDFGIYQNDLVLGDPFGYTNQVRVVCLSIHAAKRHTLEFFSESYYANHKSTYPL